MTEAAATPTGSIVMTGASTGIGEACALELDRRGFRVFAGVRREADGERLRARGSDRLTPVRIDVTDGASIAAASQTVASTVGEAGLSGLVNNAGICVAGPLELLPLAELRKQFEVNVFGPIAVTQALLPLLRRGRGRIVNVSSISGRVACPYLGPYAASKYALEAMSDSLRVETRKSGVSISIVEPGSVDTPIWQKSREACDRLRARLSEEAGRADAWAHYAPDVEAMHAATAGMGRRGMPVERVVRAVVHALCARRPRTRYPVGAGIGATIFLLKFLPDRLRDALVRRAMGLP